MINHVKIFLGKEKVEEITVGVNGVKKIFFDFNKETKESSDTLVVLTDENIVEYHGFAVVALKEYKAN